MVMLLLSLLYLIDNKKGIKRHWNPQLSRSDEHFKIQNGKKIFTNIITL